MFFIFFVSIPDALNELQFERVHEQERTQKGYFKKKKLGKIEKLLAYAIFGGMLSLFVFIEKIKDECIQENEIKHNPTG